MKPVLVVGGGISGLSLAYWLSRLNIPCQIQEAADHTGGMLKTKVHPLGLVESAANGFLPDDDILEMIHDLQIPLAPRKKERVKRFIFRQEAKRWPLKVKESLRLMIFLFKHCLRGFGRLKPLPFETVKAWALRNFDEDILDWLIAPALQGIYAGRVDQLSAALVFGRFFAKNKSRNTSGLKGTLAPERGMGQLMDSLTKNLRGRGVVINLEKPVQKIESSSFSAVVLATPAWAWSEIEIDGQTLNSDWKVDVLPLVSATLFFDANESDLKGFGCLFPKSQGFYALGVLINSSIFSNRSDQRSETWILGGAMNRDILHFSEGEILRQIQTDRKRWLGLENDIEPIGHQVTRWEKALPHLTVDLEKQVQNRSLPKNVYLTGNYLGRIGISQIVSQNRELAEKIKGAI